MRKETDFIGEKEIADNCYYGVQTLRGIENFSITKLPIKNFKSFVIALAQVKKASAKANLGIGELAKDKAEAIIKACDKVIAGEFHDQFIVDFIQGGAGTSTNMNTNEVLANVALEILGKPKGSYDIISPNDHLNLAQSTNDVYPTSLKIAFLLDTKEFIKTIKIVVEALRKKGKEFKDVVKMGRTHLQDAVPMTLGQEFDAFATLIEAEIAMMEHACLQLLEINMGATAIGTGINSYAEYHEEVVNHLSEQLGEKFHNAKDLICATSDTSSFVYLSSCLKRYAIKISKICNDLRLLASGPFCGLQEVFLPQMQPGSSIMPAKVNPVILEAMNQAAFDVIGNDLAVTMASEAAQLQLNVMEPVIGYNIYQSIHHLNNASLALVERCINGIKANPERTRLFVETSVGLVTAISPIVGYKKASAIGKEVIRSNMESVSPEHNVLVAIDGTAYKVVKAGKTVRQALKESGEFSDAQIDQMLDVKTMLAPKKKK